MGRQIALGRATAIARLSEARVAHLGTVAPNGAVRLVPTCFAVDGDLIVSAVDHKPKTTTALARLADMERAGRATLLVDHYDDADWTALWWVRVSGPAAVLSPTDPRAATALAPLIAKYPQYQDHPPTGPISTIGIEQLTWWSA